MKSEKLNIKKIWLSHNFSFVLYVYPLIAHFIINIHKNKEAQKDFLIKIVNHQLSTEQVCRQNRVLP